MTPDSTLAVTNTCPKDGVHLTLGGAMAFVVWILYFRGEVFANNKFRDRKIVHAFKMATLKHYGLFFLFRVKPIPS